ncbi:phosphatase PAP2 family protein [Tsukamurella ocularis]|uniref:phosphatase PAP2 family protein n=1 Tax=Tsukamurella ocularis TaxID=1970234 RepID=UPI00216849D7|nr:phosphatase PAP2 family protein [Tsukamurella ocularis]MCS3779112.1 undecaprenyl-diphosphatase [Tsukamurella ocularis]MCS3787268.1 undecaprenyl-diphosphatase [Tsukamurella ocularis]MCS3851795.1 undecaprenyl-diphosphatase [Tsukamurella ocularis]
MLTFSRPSRNYLAGAVALVAAVVALGLLVGWKPVTEADGEVLEEMIEHRDSATTSVMTLITDVFSPGGTIAIGIAVAALLAWRRSAASAVFVLGSTAVASAATLALKYAFARQRPPLIDHLANETDYGFPSGHVTGTTALLLATTVAITAGWTARRRLLALLVPAAVIGAVAASRLYLGVHWFSDTAAGFAIGLAGVAVGLALLPPASWSRWDRRLADTLRSRRAPRTRPVRPASH